MNKNETQAAVTDMLGRGMGKSAVFAELSGQGVKDSRLAYMAVSYTHLDVYKRQESKWHKTGKLSIEMFKETGIQVDFYTVDGLEAAP